MDHSNEMKPGIPITDPVPPKATFQGLRVLAAFLDDVRAERSGAELNKLMKIGPGTLYPILARFEHAGWLSSRWEAEEPQQLARPRRRLYKITGEGAAAHSRHSQKIMPGRLAWTYTVFTREPENLNGMKRR